MKFFNRSKPISMKKIIPIFFSFAFLFSGMFTSLQAQVELNTQVFESDVEDEIVVQFTTKNFESMVAMQFTINWNPSILSFQSVGDFNLPDLTPGSFNPNIVETGELPLAWVEGGVTGVSVPDGTSIFSITFKRLSGVPTDIFFDNTPTKIEFVKFPFEESFLNSTTNEIVVTGRLLEGKVLFDTNENCSIDDAEKGLNNWLIEITGETDRFKMTNQDGIFRAFLPFGDYNVKAIPPPNNLFSICEPEQTITIAQGATDAVNIAFTGQAIADCTSLNVEIGTPFVRRCFDNDYTVNYCNNGTIAAENVYITVDLDPAFTFVESSITGTLVEGNTYRFDVGTVDLNECKTFSIKVKVDCDNTTLGQTHCVTANIFPNVTCGAVSNAWSGASLKVESECVDGEVKFHIENEGDGSMDLEQAYVVIQDMIMLREETGQNFQLQSGERTTMTFPADGSTYRLETPQVPNHPKEFLLVTAIEGCGMNEDGTFSTGMINQFRLGDEDQFTDEDCQENIGAFDPNDKNAFPQGYSTPNYIEPNTSLTYHIRFQNTGTDTAFNIVVLDTLSELLDVSTFVPLTSSHPYELEILDSNILKYSFNNIMLADSNINEAASHGFFKFQIDQQLDVALGSLLENSAAIYFDFNEPVITNTYSHTIGVDFIELKLLSGIDDVSPVQMQISPNPVTETATIRIENDNHSEGVFRLYDLQGRTVGAYEFFGNEFQFQKGNLAEGLYLFEIQAEGSLIGTGKLMIKEGK